MKYLLVSGGVISGIGKGIIASSSGLLLKSSGFRVTSIKIDPYIGVDAGLMSPLEHGECFVLDDGGETDLDLGNYERYLSIKLTKAHNITTGKIYKHVIERERRGDYLGKTVQVVPHVTDAIQKWIEDVAKTPVDESGLEPDVCIIELGGTVGDIESMPFVEALVQLRHRAGRGHFVNIHVSYVPVIGQEQKTKPTQHAVKSVRSAGLIPDIIACRCEDPLDAATVAKIAHHCQVDLEQVLAVRNMETIYQVPMLLHEQGLTTRLRSFLRLDQLPLMGEDRVTQGQNLWEKWNDTVMPQRHLDTVTVALVGKYVELHDAYLSVIKALEHSAMHCKRKLNLVWVDSEHLEESARETNPARFHKAWHEVCTASGILCPGGFGIRGIEGKILAAKWAREQKKPYLGICLGMQVAVCEYARHIAGIPKATSEEFNAQAEEKVIIFMPEIDKTTMGGNMRLGSRPTFFQEGSEWSKLRTLYGGVPSVDERHRHRYEVNPDYIDRLEAAGLSFIGRDDKGERMEIIELKDHPFFVGIQYHPEYLSRVLKPSPCFLGFIAASAGCLHNVLEGIKNKNAQGDSEGSDGTGKTSF